MEKKINLTERSTGTVIRLLRNEAEQRMLTEPGEYVPTSKGRLKSYLNRASKLTRNKRTLQRSETQKEFIDQQTGKHYSDVVVRINENSVWEGRILIRIPN